MMLLLLLIIALACLPTAIDVLVELAPFIGACLLVIVIGFYVVGLGVWLGHALGVG